MDSVEPSPVEVFDMRKFIGVLIALGAAPVLASVTLLPVTADVSVAGGNACAPQSANPHPTDPAGSTTAALFCTTPSPTQTASGGTGGNNGSDGSGSTASQGSGSGGTASNGGGATTTLASTTSGSTTPDESTRFNWASSDTTGANTSGQQPASKGQLSDGLLAFFSGTGGLVFLYSMLVLLVLVGLAATAVAWIRRGAKVPWSEHTSRLTYRAKP
jgi:hypothetical protein